MKVIADDYSSELLSPPSFLILGITGPYGAGCTALAEWIADGLEDDLGATLTTGLESIEVRLSECVGLLQATGEAAADRAAGRSVPQLPALDPSYPIVSYRRTDLGSRPDGASGHYHVIHKRLLEQRRWMSALKSAQLGGKWQRFQRISLSDMIVKICIEECDYFADRGDEAQHEIVEALRVFRDDNRNGFEASLEIGRSLRTGAYSELAANVDLACAFEQYLAALNEFHKNLRRHHRVAMSQFLQDRGEELRRHGCAFGCGTGGAQEGGDYCGRIAEEANLLTKFFRQTPSDSRTGWFVMECFRTRAEVEHFRRRIESFFLVSVFATYSDRRERKRKQWSENFDDPKEIGRRFEELEKKDRGPQNESEKLEFWPINVEAAVDVSDIAINNPTVPEAADQEAWEPVLQRKFLRMLSLITEPGCCPPTAAEENMHLAHSAALRSTCMSRQVGAVITKGLGHVLAVGWNDTGMGQLGCGLGGALTGGSLQTKYDQMRAYLEERLGTEAWSKVWLDIGMDNLFCFRERVTLLDEMCSILRKPGDAKEVGRLIARGPEDGKHPGELVRLAQVLNHAVLGRRVDFCRALHAEENALLQANRLGGVSVADGTIYVTASPCEMCTKSLYQAGIKKIVYTQVYPGTWAHAFRTDGIRNINFEQFEGVKSPGYYRLFKPDYPLKDAQAIRRENRSRRSKWAENTTDAGTAGYGNA